jgi:hypothetical protein
MNGFNVLDDSHRFLAWTSPPPGLEELVERRLAHADSPNPDSNRGELARVNPVPNSLRIYLQGSSDVIDCKQLLRVTKASITQ